MQVWKIIIRPDPDASDRRQGYALAESEDEALALAADCDALAFPVQSLWPGEDGKRVYWSN